MPTPARTSLEEIVAVGRRLVEEEGLDGLTMKEVARAVGVRAPSLYKHVASRGDLIRHVADSVLEDLADRIEVAVSGDDPRGDLAALANAFRQFARSQPGAYRLIFAELPDDQRPDPELLVRASDPVLRTAGALAGPDRALEAARTVTAWAHGFVTMELAGAFQLDGDIDDAFTFGVERLGEALAIGG